MCWMSIFNIQMERSKNTNQKQVEKTLELCVWQRNTCNIRLELTLNIYFHYFSCLTTVKATTTIRPMPVSMQTLDFCVEFKIRLPCRRRFKQYKRFNFNILCISHGMQNIGSVARWWRCCFACIHIHTWHISKYIVSCDLTGFSYPCFARYIHFIRIIIIKRLAYVRNSVDACIWKHLIRKIGKQPHICGYYSIMVMHWKFGVMQMHIQHTKRTEHT